MTRVQVVAAILPLMVIQSSLSLAFEPVRQVRIKSEDFRDDLCKDIKQMTRQQVIKFFEKAKRTSFADLHDYNQLNCHVRGTLKRGSKQYEFDIQPIWVGSLKDLKSKHVEWFACDDCDDFLPPHRD